MPWSSAQPGATTSEQAIFYARVDGCLVDGTFILLELELLEPDLLLNLDAQAPTRFAEALLSRV